MGIRVCRGAPTISQLFFMDDRLIFCKATPEASNHLLKILNEYALASCQYINQEKTTMVFSRNVKEENRAEISTNWGCSERPNDMRSI